MLTLDAILRLGGFLAVALLVVSVWTRRQRARARVLHAEGHAAEAQAIYDRLDAYTPMVVLSVVGAATLLLVA